jgi:hypothetical protein
VNSDLLKSKARGEHLSRLPLVFFGKSGLGSAVPRERNKILRIPTAVRTISDRETWRRKGTARTVDTKLACGAAPADEFAGQKQTAKLNWKKIEEEEKAPSLCLR